MFAHPPKEDASRASHFIIRNGWWDDFGLFHVTSVDKIESARDEYFDAWFPPTAKILSQSHQPADKGAGDFRLHSETHPLSAWNNIDPVRLEPLTEQEALSLADSGCHDQAHFDALRNVISPDSDARLHWSTREQIRYPLRACSGPARIEKPKRSAGRLTPGRSCMKSDATSQYRRTAFTQCSRLADPQTHIQALAYEQCRVDTHEEGRVDKPVEKNTESVFVSGYRRSWLALQTQCKEARHFKRDFQRRISSLTSSWPYKAVGTCKEYSVEVPQGIFAAPPNDVKAVPVIRKPFEEPPPLPFVAFTDVLLDFPRRRAQEVSPFEMLQAFDRNRGSAKPGPEYLVEDPTLFEILQGKGVAQGPPYLPKDWVKMRVWVGNDKDGIGGVRGVGAHNSEPRSSSQRSPSPRRRHVSRKAGSQVGRAFGVQKSPKPTIRQTPAAARRPPVYAKWWNPGSRQPTVGSTGASADGGSGDGDGSGSEMQRRNPVMWIVDNIAIVSKYDGGSTGRMERKEGVKLVLDEPDEWV